MLAAKPTQGAHEAPAIAGSVVVPPQEPEPELGARGEEMLGQMKMGDWAGPQDAPLPSPPPSPPPPSPRRERFRR
jgi:hypothetical protein